MPPLIYCDQNFLISLFGEQKSYKDRLRKLVSDGRIKLVLSMWHWVEMARDKDHGHALALADFADSLDPLWLRDRVSLHREHMLASFCAWIGIPYSQPAAAVSRREMVADLFSQPVARIPDLSSRQIMVADLFSQPVERITDLSSRQFVERWRAKRDSLERIIAAHQSNMQSFGWLRAHLRRVAKERDRARRAALRGFLPERTPAGVVIDQRTKERFLQECDLARCGTLAVEIVISEEDRHFLGRLRWQHFVDRQHVVPALPHVDVFATNDQRLVRLVCRVRPRLPFTIARTVVKQAFDSNYIGVTV